MTCIIGLVDNGKVYIGGDRSAVDGWQRKTNGMSKVFRVGEMLIGWTGTGRGNDLVRYEFKPAPQSDSVGEYEYLCTTVANGLRDLFTSRGLVKKNDDGEDEFSGGGLIGYRGVLYRMSNNFQINRFDRNFEAVGSGAPFALGAMAALALNLPRLRIQNALLITESLCIDVSNPFDVEVI